MFWLIIMPQLRPATFIAVVITVVGALRSFDLVQVMIDGGPYGSSSILAYSCFAIGHQFSHGLRSGDRGGPVPNHDIALWASRYILGLSCFTWRFKRVSALCSRDPRRLNERLLLGVGVGAERHGEAHHHRNRLAPRAVAGCLAAYFGRFRCCRTPSGRHVFHLAASIYRGPDAGCGQVDFIGNTKSGASRRWRNGSYRETLPVGILLFLRSSVS